MTSIDTLINRIGDAIVNPIILLLFSVAFLIFLWGVFEFVMNADDPGARQKGKDHLIWGVLGMVIMVGALGIVAIIKATVAHL